jgi:arylsulfatase A-like enzyme
VPAFISNLGNSTGTVSSLLHLADWLPTVVQGLAGGPEIPGLDGINQLDVLRGLSEPLRTEVLYDIANFDSVKYNHTVASAPETFQLSGAFGAALRVGDYKLVAGCSTLPGCARNYNSTWSGNMDRNRTQLYDLARDPGETTDLAGEPVLAGEVAGLRARLEHHLARAVTPLHGEADSSGHPIYSFPLLPAQFFTSWCQSRSLPTL